MPSHLFLVLLWACRAPSASGPPPASELAPSARLVVAESSQGQDLRWMWDSEEPAATAPPWPPGGVFAEWFEANFRFDEPVVAVAVEILPVPHRAPPTPVVVSFDGRAVRVDVAGDMPTRIRVDTPFREIALAPTAAGDGRFGMVGLRLVDDAGSAFAVQVQGARTPSVARIPRDHPVRWALDVPMEAGCVRYAEPGIAYHRRLALRRDGTFVYRDGSAETRGTWSLPDPADVGAVRLEWAGHSRDARLQAAAEFLSVHDVDALVALRPDEPAPMEPAAKDRGECVREIVGGEHGPVGEALAQAIVLTGSGFADDVYFTWRGIEDALEVQVSIPDGTELACADVVLRDTLPLGQPTPHDQLVDCRLRAGDEGIAVEVPPDATRVECHRRRGALGCDVR